MVILESQMEVLEISVHLLESFLMPFISCLFIFL